MTAAGTARRGAVPSGRAVAPDRQPWALATRAAAAVLCLHGLVHLLGVLSGWRLAEGADLPDTSRLLGGVELGGLGQRVLGAGWLAAAIVVVAGGVAVWRRAARRRALVTGGALLSLLLCLLAWPEAATGVVVNLVVLGLLLGTASRGKEQ